MTLFSGYTQVPNIVNGDILTFSQLSGSTYLTRCISYVNFKADLIADLDFVNSTGASTVANQLAVFSDTSGDTIAPYTGTGTAELTAGVISSTYTVTAAAKTVLDDTTVSAMLTTLGGQPVNAGLTVLSSIGTGLVANTGSNTFSPRSLTQPASGITISNPGGIAGNPTFALANDLAAVEGLSSTGFAVRTATDTWANRTLTQGTGITITNGDGVAGNPTISANTPFTKSFISAAQTVTFAGSLTLAHGLGTTPTLIISTWICQTAEAGYTAGDRVAMPGLWGDNGTSSYGATVTPDATNLNVRYGSAGILLNKSTGARTGITAANWKVEFAAYA